MQIRSYHFFFCLPVRLGVFVLAMFGLVGGIIVAATGWLQVSQLHQHPLALFDSIALYLHTIVFTTIAIAALFGLGAATVDRPVLLKAYGYTLAAFLGISIASGCVALYSLFRAKNQGEIGRCMNGATDKLTGDVCRTGIALFKGTGLAIYLVSWLYLGYACVIVASYVAELREKESVSLKPRMVGGVKIGNPEPLMMYNSVGAPGINNGYAFSHVPVGGDVGRAV